MGRGPNAFDFSSQIKLLVARDTYSSRSLDFRAVFPHLMTLHTPQNPCEVPKIPNKTTGADYWYTVIHTVSVYQYYTVPVSQPVHQLV